LFTIFYLHIIHQICNFTCHIVWVWNYISHSKERTYSDIIQEQGAEENILDQLRESTHCEEKYIFRSLYFVFFIRYY
jgi:hypothetical protein